MTGESDGQSGAVVIHVEDNPGDVRLLREVLTPQGCTLHVASDGVDALQFLTRRPPYQGVPRPDLVVLDLDLPKLPGLELLDRVKTDDHLKTVPVVVLSSSENPDDVARAYRRHANAYLVKPGNLDEYETLVERLEAFWLHAVKPSPIEP